MPEGMRALSVVCTGSLRGAEVRLLVRVCASDALVLMAMRGSIDASALTADVVTASSCDLWRKYKYGISDN